MPVDEKEYQAMKVKLERRDKALASMTEKFQKAHKEKCQLQRKMNATKKAVKKLHDILGPDNPKQMAILASAPAGPAKIEAPPTPAAASTRAPPTPAAAEASSRALAAVPSADDGDSRHHGLSFYSDDDLQNRSDDPYIDEEAEAELHGEERHIPEKQAAVDLEVEEEFN